MDSENKKGTIAKWPVPPTIQDIFVKMDDEFDEGYFKVVISGYMSKIKAIVLRPVLFGCLINPNVTPNEKLYSADNVKIIDEILEIESDYENIEQPQLMHPLCKKFRMDYRNESSCESTCCRRIERCKKNNKEINCCGQAICEASDRQAVAEFLALLNKVPANNIQFNEVNGYPQILYQFQCCALGFIESLAPVMLNDKCVGCFFAGQLGRPVVMDDDPTISENIRDWYKKIENHDQYEKKVELNEEQLKGLIKIVEETTAYFGKCYFQRQQAVADGIAKRVLFEFSEKAKKSDAGVDDDDYCNSRIKQTVDSFFFAVNLWADWFNLKQIEIFTYDEESDLSPDNRKVRGKIQINGQWVDSKHFLDLSLIEKKPDNDSIETKRDKAEMALGYNPVEIGHIKEDGNIQIVLLYQMGGFSDVAACSFILDELDVQDDKNRELTATDFRIINAFEQLASFYLGRLNALLSVRYKEMYQHNSIYVEHEIRTVSADLGANVRELQRQLGISDWIF